MEKVGIKETCCLFTILIISTVTLGAGTDFVRGFGAAAYINPILNAVLAVAIVSVANFSLRESDFYLAVSGVYGKIAGNAFMCAIFIITLLSATVRLEMFTDAIGEFVLPRTPDVVIAAVISLCAFFVSYFGFEAITRYSLVGVGALLVFLAIIFASSSTEIKLSNLSPGATKVGFAQIVSSMYVFADIVYLYFIPSKTKFARVGVRAIALGGAIAGAVTLFYVMCVPYPVSKGYMYPLYTLASLSNSSVVFQRMDGLVFIIWIFASFISTGALCLFATEIFSRIFSLSDRRALSAAVSLLIFLFSYFGSIDHRAIFAATTLVCFVFLPITALIYKFWRKKKCSGR